jgi:methionyl-tRNA formyltransferase
VKTLFFGTPDFAVPTLAAMIGAGYAPALVVSQPARPVGRKRRLRQTPVGDYAETHDLPLAQPESVRDKGFLARLDALSPDVAVVVAFGQIFRRRLLELPRLGCVNVHASILPRYRGAAPIQAAIAAGDEVTGVTTMRMDRGLDSGDMLLVDQLTIGPHETTPELAPRLARLGADLLVRTLRRLEAGELEGEPQDHGAATYAPRLEKEDGRIDWRRSAREIYNRWRAHLPWPGSTAELRGKALKILRCSPGGVPAEAAPGMVLGLVDGALHVACGGGTRLALEEVQAAGKKPVSARDFVNGERLEETERFALPAVPDPPSHPA